MTRRRDATDLTGNEDLEAFADGRETECSAVESLVVEPAQGQPIRYFVGAAVRMPLNVGSFDTNPDIPELHVEVADCTTVLVLAQDFASEGGVAWLGGGIVHFLSPRDANGFPDVVVQGLGEMTVQELLSGFPDQFGCITEHEVGRFRESALNVAAPQLLDGKIPA